jgi:hypothetical protein
MPSDSYLCEYCEIPFSAERCSCEDTYYIIERYLSDVEVLDPTELTKLIVAKREEVIHRSYPQALI